jgi:hypothetical protein
MISPILTLHRLGSYTFVSSQHTSLNRTPTREPTVLPTLDTTQNTNLSNGSTITQYWYFFARTLRA